MNPYNSVQVTPQKKENPPFSIGATSSNQAYKIVSNFHGPLVPLNFGDILGVLISTWKMTFFFFLLLLLLLEDHYSKSVVYFAEIIETEESVTSQ